jgi:hypothetical protein
LSTLLITRVVTVTRSGVDAAVQTVLLMAGPGREEQAVGRLTRQSVADAQAPQAVDFQRLAICCTELPEKIARGCIERIDGAIAEVADEEAIAEAPEVRGRKRDSPRCIQVAAGSKELILTMRTPEGFEVAFSLSAAAIAGLTSVIEEHSSGAEPGPNSFAS